MFSPEDRRIFGPYFNGAEMVHADPLQVYRRLQFRLDGESNKYLKLAREGDPSEKFHAWEKLIPAVRYAFDMPDFDPSTGKGSQEADCRAVLRAYLEFVQEKKEPGPTCQTYSLPTPASVQAGPSPMKKSFPFGSTLTGKPSGKPGQ